MRIITDNIEFSGLFLPEVTDWKHVSIGNTDNMIKPLFKDLCGLKKIYSVEYPKINSWDYLFLIEESRKSQFDILSEASQKGSGFQGNIACIAGTGKKFHGFRNRPWLALPGNIHLSVLLTPNMEIEPFVTGFLLISAVSVIETLDSIPGLENKAKIKWVNDIIIENSKVCGVITNTHTQGYFVKDAIIGIGLNIESKPIVNPTPFTPITGCLNDFLDNDIKCKIKDVFPGLLNNLSDNYNRLISGEHSSLLKIYRERSAIIGKKVSIYSETNMGREELERQGIVAAIGNNLELYFEDYSLPVTMGRLKIEESED
jgi:biotin-[acetyl-CoA-carboxylase] ligase BirA-like protein